MSKIPFHAGFSLRIIEMTKKENARKFWYEGFVLCVVKHSGEIVTLNGHINIGAVFAADRSLKRGIYTDGSAVKFVKPEELTTDELTHLAGMFPRKL